MRTEEVGRMREEIGVLRSRVAEGGQIQQAGGGDDVPRETFENLQREKEELEEVVKQKEKRLLRLKSVSVFSSMTTIRFLVIFAVSIQLTRVLRFSNPKRSSSETRYPLY
jgi:hypothetical protein